MSKPRVTFIGLALLVVVNACGSPPTVPSPTSLSVTRMIPDTGSTFGSVSSVVGTGFADGDVVRIDGAVATAVVLNPTVIHVTMSESAVKITAHRGYQALKRLLRGTRREN